MSDDQKVQGEIQNAHETVNDLVKMGKNLGFQPMEWASLLMFASQAIQTQFDFKIMQIDVVKPSGAQCDCEKCKARRAREGFHVVPT